MSDRIKYLDALRGLAVILMVQQHLQNWLWNKQWISYSYTFPEHPIMLSLNFLGNFSAAIFLIVAGFGSAILYNNTSKVQFLKRGIFILLCGYLLNVITPYWFKPGSWYILHTMGIAVIISPLLNKMKTTGLLILFALFIVTPAFIQTLLNTSLMLGNDSMNDVSMNGGIFRLIFAEGHFPLFPWLALFMSGVICSRWFNDKKNVKILIMSIILISISILFSWFYKHGYFFATGGKFFRMFIYLPYIYPPLPAFILLVSGIALLIVFLFSFLERGRFEGAVNILASVGRLSLSWFFIHIIIFNEFSSWIGIRNTLGSAETILLIIISIIIMIIISVKWNKRELKFTLEQLMRRVIKL